MSRQIQKILVTGHRGYIGALLLPTLVSEGFEVVGMDCGLYESSHFHGRMTEVPWLRKDIRLATAGDLEGIDAVVHLAALSNDPTGKLNATATDSINREATVNLARLAVNAGVQSFVFMSSCSLYGASGPAAIDETAPANPLTEYGRSKIAAESALMAMDDDSLAVCCLRGGTAYGGSPRLRLDLLINDLVASACSTGRIELLSDGQAWRPLVHIGDFANAITAVLKAPRHVIASQVFNVGRNDQNYRVVDAAQLVRDRFSSARFAIAAGAGTDTRSYRVCFDKLHRTLPGIAEGWRLVDGIEELAQLCERRIAAVGPWQSHRFSRIAVLKSLIDSKRIDLEDPECITSFAASA